jgi:hypothetical protein
VDGYLACLVCRGRLYNVQELNNLDVMSEILKGFDRSPQILYWGHRLFFICPSYIENALHRPWDPMYPLPLYLYIQTLYAVCSAPGIHLSATDTLSRISKASFVIVRGTCGFPFF